MYHKLEHVDVPASIQDAQLSGNHYFYFTDGKPIMRLSPDAVLQVLTIRGLNRTINNMHANPTMVGATGF